MEKKFKVLLLNGSPREHGNIALAVHDMEQVFAENGVEYETVLLGRNDIRGCIACESCRKTGRCVFNDVVNDLAAKFEAADGLVLHVTSPIVRQRTCLVSTFSVGLSFINGNAANHCPSR